MIPGYLRPRLCSAGLDSTPAGGTARMTIFSFRTLAFSWAALAAAAATGAVALQVRFAPPAPAAPAVPAPDRPPADTPPAATLAVAPAVLQTPPATGPMPFNNRSLIALLPPDHPHPATRQEALPVPPVPPVRHFARAEPRRSAPVYAAASHPYQGFVYQTPAYQGPVYPSWGWGGGPSYPGQYAAAARPAWYGSRPGQRRTWTAAETAPAGRWRRFTWWRACSTYPLPARS